MQKRVTLALVAGFCWACGGSEATPSDASVAPNEAGDVASSDASSETPPPPPNDAGAPFGWVGIIGTGQSLAVGTTAGNISTSQPYKHLKLVDNGPNPRYPIDGSGAPKWSAVPLTEPLRTAVPGTGPGYTDDQYPNNVKGETPHSAMASAISLAWAARGYTADYVTVHTEVGWGGHCLFDIDKTGQRAYPASLHEATIWKGLAQAAGVSYGVGAITLTHGECDQTNPNYAAGLYKLWQDYDADVKALTGQTRDVVLLVSQQSTRASGAQGSAVQVWLAGTQHPGQVVCTGPKYAYQYASDGSHLGAGAYARLGAKYGEVFDIVFNQQKPWQPLQPINVTRAGAVITIPFNVPNPPLVFDGHMAAAHQSVNTEWKDGRGFEVSAGATKLVISKAEIQGSSVILTLASDPGATKVTVGYALTQDATGTGYFGGSLQGLRGALRDSDAFVGPDLETLDVSVIQGSAVVTTTGGAFARRTAWDLVSGGALPADTIVTRQDSATQVTLSTPWPGATGTAKLTFHHDHHNWAVHFALTEP